jgi:hypothetical protein
MSRHHKKWHSLAHPEDDGPVMVGKHKRYSKGFCWVMNVLDWRAHCDTAATGSRPMASCATLAVRWTTDMLTNDEIKAIIEQAFKPFHCVVEIRPNDQVRFKVMDKKIRLYASPGFAEGFPLSNVRTKDLLKAFLMRARAQLEADGRSLDPW